MATYYVGSGGNNGNNGLSWANRKLTLNGVEDIPVAAGDIVYVAPGSYNEMLTLDVSGSSGNPITYIGDVTGQNTDGIGGPVRITGSSNNQTAANNNCITGASRSYRTFRGFYFDTVLFQAVTLTTASGNNIIEDCYFAGLGQGAVVVNIAGTGTNNTIRRCVFIGAQGTPIGFTHTSTVDSSGHVVENCLFVGPANRGIGITRVGGITINHCTFIGCPIAIQVDTALTVGQTTTVRNSQILWCYAAGMQAVTAPGTNLEITEDYNNFWGSGTARINVTTGSNSSAHTPLFEAPILLDGYQFPWNPFALSSWSTLRRKAGTSMASDGLFGITRPATDSKKSWGAIQGYEKVRETTTTRTGTASIKLSDAGVHQMFVPTTNTSTTISVYVQWEADYAGTLPQLIVKQPGQSDQTDTATGSSGNWEQLSVTFTPAATPSYCVVELWSHNTASSTNYDTFFDDLVVS